MKKIKFHTCKYADEKTLIDEMMKGNVDDSTYTFDKVTGMLRFISPNWNYSYSGINNVDLVFVEFTLNTCDGSNTKNPGKDICENNKEVTLYKVVASFATKEGLNKNLDKIFVSHLEAEKYYNELVINCL